jgi:AcrR family transcriptional regulator
MEDQLNKSLQPSRRKKEGKSETADNTRDKILDAAEFLFGERTFDTVSLRDITQRAGVTLALSSYHFHTKERLFAEIVGRRADLLNEMRRDRLKKLSEQGPLTTEKIIEAFMRPLFEQMADGSEGWQSYLYILAKLAQTNRWLHLLHENFDPTAEIFLAELKRTLPDLPEPVLLRGFSLGLVAMLQTLSKNRRLDALSAGTVSADDLESAYTVLIRFVVKGLEGLRGL